jgi:hypothetical protein
MPDKRGGSTPEQYEETVTPANPPQATAGPATVVAGMWYYLAPIVLIVAVMLLAIFYWGDRDDPQDAVEPTTGIQDESTPGGGDPAPAPDNAQEERELKGGDQGR